MWLLWPPISEAGGPTWELLCSNIPVLLVLNLAWFGLWHQWRNLLSQYRKPISRHVCHLTLPTLYKQARLCDSWETCPYSWACTVLFLSTSFSRLLLKFLLKCFFIINFNSASLNNLHAMENAYVYTYTHTYTITCTTDHQIYFET